VQEQKQYKSDTRVLAVENMHIRDTGERKIVQEEEKQYCPARSGMIGYYSKGNF